MATVARGGVGSTQDPWFKFCAVGEIASAAATKDVAASVVQQLKHVSVTSFFSSSFLELYRFRSSALIVLVTGGCLRRAHCFGGVDLGVLC
jgi:hypothetical protein